MIRKYFSKTTIVVSPRDVLDEQLVATPNLRVALFRLSDRDEPE